MAPTIGIDIRVLGTGRHSGIEEYTERLLEHLLPLDPKVRFVLFYAGRKKLERLPFMNAANVRVYDSGFSNRLLWAATRLTGRPYLDRLVGGADAFFFPHFLVGATSPACRRILTMHDLSFEHFPELLSRGRRMWHRFQMRPRVQAAHADQLIAVSESTRQDIMSRYGIEGEKIVTIHSGIDPALVRPPESDIERFRRDHALPKRFILVLGTLEPRKNIAGTIAAFEGLKPSYDDVELIIAGSRGWLWDDIVARAERSGRRGRIRFIDPVARSERPFWLAAAWVLAYPSFLEGFGFPPLEAMACGTPVLVAANSSLLEVCGNAALAANPYSVTQMTAALTTLLDDRPFRNMLIAQGLERARQFSWQTSAERTLEAILSVLSDTVQ